MSDVVLASGGEPLSVVLVKRAEYEQERDPNLRLRDTAVLKDGPQAYKVATHWVVVDQHTGELHHHVLKIETFRHRPGTKNSEGKWTFERGRSITLDNHKDNEIAALLSFVRAITDNVLPAPTGEYLIVPIRGELKAGAARQLFDAASDSTKLIFLAEALAEIKGNTAMLRELAERAAEEPEASKEVAAALNLARFQSALRKLEDLIEDNAGEGAFQSHLQQNPWMFGSEYSHLLDQRDWTRGKQQDFMLRRTADGYLEIIEIKTPLGGDPLFQYDRSHKSYFARSDVTKVVGQVIGYLDDLDADRDRIKARDRENVSKVRAKIIIGRDGDEGQCAALRSYNGHLQRIEILTFDQLVRIARRVVSYSEELMAPGESSQDVRASKPDEPEAYCG